MAGSPPPSKIMIIRHAEKPPDPPNTKGPWDVQLNGQPGNGKSLIVPGWQRAGALNDFFAPYKSKPTTKKIVTPHHIYAASPEGNETKRPWETVTPLAAWLSYKQGGSRFNVSYKIGDEKNLVKSVLKHSSPVLVCWEHDHIMPDMVGEINKKCTISNYSSIPNPFPDVFYLVWVLDLKGSSYTWSSVNQNLMAGDVS
jgi:hypothetical protein